VAASIVDGNAILFRLAHDDRIEQQALSRIIKAFATLTEQRSLHQRHVTLHRL
jgi:hypothetical protein